MRNIYHIIGATCIVLLAACSSAPYVHEAGKFDRSSEGFGQDPTDITAVTICYSESASTPADIIKLAMDACGDFGKTARFDSQSYLTCPLVAPVAVKYTCESPSSATSGSSLFTY